MKQCIICKKPFEGFGNNPAPITDVGQCCNTCNITKVIPRRLKELQGGKNNVRKKEKGKVSSTA